MKLPYQPARYFVLLLLVTIFGACSSSKVVVNPSAKNDVNAELQRGPIDVPREFRAAWVATVANINWPSKRSEEHTSELQSRENLVCRLLLEKKNRRTQR